MHVSNAFSWTDEYIAPCAVRLTFSLLSECSTDLPCFLSPSQREVDFPSLNF